MDRYFPVMNEVGSHNLLMGKLGISDDELSVLTNSGCHNFISDHLAAEI